MSAPAFDLASARIFVAGHRGMVGSAIVRRLATEKAEILTVPRAQLDLKRQADVERWMQQNRPDVVVIAAAKVGGIQANSMFPADFLSDNLTIQSNLINSAAEFGARKLLFLGSSCIYPKFAPQPILESALLTGALEPTNQWYAVAKIAGIMMCDSYRQQHGLDFISAMPTNLYGPGDNYDLNNSHVIPALIRKAIVARDNDAADMVVWGSGQPRREFLHADDLADAVVFLLRYYSESGPINVGSGSDVTIAEIAALIKELVGFRGNLLFDTEKPDGTPRKLMDSKRIKALGWQPQIELRDGLERTIRELPAHIFRT